MSEQPAERLRREMQTVRQGLDNDAEHVAASARRLRDWRYYVHAYPWACIGACAVVGYLVIPKKTNVITPRLKDLEQLAKKNELVVKRAANVSSSRSLGRTAAVFIGNALLRAGLSYLGRRVGKTAGEEMAPDHEIGRPIVPR